MTDLDDAKRDLLKTFKRSLRWGAVLRGGPGGFPVDVDGTRWTLGWSPGRIFYAHGPGISFSFSPSATSLSTKYDSNDLQCNVTPPCQLSDTVSLARVSWLIQLLKLANYTNPEGRITALKPFPND